ncbi:AIPR family protein [Oscillospiraceae bacterium 50-16]
MKERIKNMAKILTNDQLLIREYVKQQFSASQFSKESDYFEFFATSQALKEYDLSDEEIESGLMGGGGDGGCDGAYLFYNDTLVGEEFIANLKDIPRTANIQVVIVQAKNELSFHEDAIMKWKAISENLLQFDNQIDKYAARYSESVRNFFQNFKDLRIKLMAGRRVQVSFKYLYVSLAKELSSNVEDQARELEQLLHTMFPGTSTSAEVKFIDASALMELFNTQVSQDFTLPLEEIPISIGDYKNYVALVKLSNYYRFITDDKGSLKKYIFESNVRDYQGHTNVNNEIYSTLSEKGAEDFWWLNNGITILASNITPATQKQLVITDPEIVNGLQTSNEIYRFFKNHQDLLETETRNILLRIIIPEDENSRDRIILATNNQTLIPLVALRATDPIHRQIEMFFKSRGLFYDRRKNYYKNQGKKPHEIVSIGFLGQCLMSLFLGKPNYARARPSTLLSDDANYNKLYKDNPDLEVYFKSALLGKRVERHIKSSENYTTAEKSDILFYVVYFLAGKLLHTPDIRPNQFKEISVDAIDENMISEATQTILQMYHELGGNNKVAKGSELLDRIQRELASTGLPTNLPTDCPTAAKIG